MTTITNNELTDDVLEYVLAVVEDRYENRKSNAGEDDRIILALRELQKRRKASKEPVRYLNKFSGVCVTLEQQPNASDDVAVYMPLYAAPPASEREQVRREHAEWSDKTFGDIGPVGPLKHLSKEALEAAADPSDPLEWADMQFLLWDAQRRMGISDEFITRAMIEKLEINKTRQWPEPKDGEPQLHIKEQPAPVVLTDEQREQLRQMDDEIVAELESEEIVCRAAMLQANQRDLSQPVGPQVAEYEKIMLQAGWVMVPIEPTEEMIAAAMECDDVVFDSKDPTAFCVQFREIYCAMVDVAPKPEITSE